MNCNYVLRKNINNLPRHTFSKNHEYNVKHENSKKMSTMANNDFSELSELNFIDVNTEEQNTDKPMNDYVDLKHKHNEYFRTHMNNNKHYPIKNNNRYSQNQQNMGQKNKRFQRHQPNQQNNNSQYMYNIFANDESTIELPGQTINEERTNGYKVKNSNGKLQLQFNNRNNTQVNLTNNEILKDFELVFHDEKSLLNDTPEYITVPEYIVAALIYYATICKFVTFDRQCELNKLITNKYPFVRKQDGESDETVNVSFTVQKKNGIKMYANVYDSNTPTKYLIMYKKSGHINSDENEFIDLIRSFHFKNNNNTDYEYTVSTSHGKIDLPEYICNFINIANKIIDVATNYEDQDVNVINSSIKIITSKETTIIKNNKKIKCKITITNDELDKYVVLSTDDNQYKVKRKH